MKKEIVPDLLTGFGGGSPCTLRSISTEYTLHGHLKAPLIHDHERNLTGR